MRITPPNAHGGVGWWAACGSVGRSAARAATVLLLRFLGTAFQLGLTILVTRCLGANGSGYVFTWLSWSTMAASVLAMGFPTYVVRELAVVSDSSAAPLGSIYLRIIGATLGVAIVTRALGPFLPGPTEYNFILTLAVISGGATALLDVAASSLIGARDERSGVAFRFVAPPAAMGAFVGILAALGCPLTVAKLACGYTFVITWFAVGAHVLYARQVGSVQLWGSVNIPSGLWGINIVNAVYVGLPYFALPYVAPSRDIAYYAVGHRIASVAQTAQVALGSYFAPRISKAYASNNRQRLIYLFHSSQAALLCVLSPLGFVFTPAASWVLLVFGSEFSDAWLYVAIAAGGRMVVGACGLTEYFLMMTRHERWEIGISAIAFTVLTCVLLAAGQWGGAKGVAAAFYSVSIAKACATLCACIVLMYADTPTLNGVHRVKLGTASE